MKKLIHIGHVPSNHAIMFCLIAEGSLIETLSLAAKLVLGGLFLPMAWVFKRPLNIGVKPIKEKP